MIFPPVERWDYVVIDTETTGLRWWHDKMFSFAVCSPRGLAQYFDIRQTPQAIEWLRDVAPQCKLFVAHNAKFDIHMLREAGVQLPMNKVVCTMTRAALIDEHLLSYDLDSLGKRYCNVGKMGDIYEELAKLFGGSPTKNAQAPNMHRAPAALIGQYAKQDVTTTNLLHQWQLVEIVKQGLEKVDKLERDLLPVIVRMEQCGVRVDVDAAERAVPVMNKQVEDAQRELNRIAGFTINPNPSGSIHELFKPKNEAAVGDRPRWVLIDGTVAETTDSGKASINADVLRSMKHPAAALILKCRKLIKTRDTFIKGHILGHHHDGIIHANFNQCATADTLILTNSGWVKIVDVKVGAKVIDHTGGVQSVLARHDNGMKPVYRITSQRGHIITVTGNHPFMSDGEWVNADVLRLGSSLIVTGDPEEFKAIRGFEDYEVSSWGRVRRNGKFLSLSSVKKTEHLKVVLCKNGKCYTRRVHRLVAESFVPGHGDEVMHNHGIAWVNIKDGLSWGNRRANCLTASRQGSMKRANKLSPNDVDYIRNSTGVSSRALGKMFGVTGTTILAVKRGSLHKTYRPFEDKRVALYHDSVALIEKLPPENTYGLEVSGSHSHITNGIATHNTKTEGDVGTGTGRLSVNAPALQQIHKRDADIASVVRSLFLPVGLDRGHLWRTNDWSSMDFRIFAHYLSDQRILDQYNRDPNTDFHQITGDLTGLPRKPRFAGDPNSKQLNLSMVFGAGQGKVAAMMGLPFEWEQQKDSDGKVVKEWMRPGPEAVAVFEKYHSAIPGVRDLLKNAASVARSRGYVITAMGRHIRFPRGQFTHKAGGLIFQGTAADAMKVKLVEVDEYLRSINNPEDAALMLTVHDELAHSIAPHRTDVMAEIDRIYTKFDGDGTPMKLRVPITTSSGLAGNWWLASKD